MAQNFNKKLEDFFADLKCVFPDSKELREVRNKFNILKTVSEKRPLAMFKKYIPLYKDKILVRNAAFFMDTPEFFELDKAHLDKLRHHWLQLDNANQEAIWDHLVTLVQVGV